MSQADNVLYTSPDGMNVFIPCSCGEMTDNIAFHSWPEFDPQDPIYVSVSLRPGASWKSRISRAWKSLWDRGNEDSVGISRETASALANWLISQVNKSKPSTDPNQNSIDQDNPNSRYDHINAQRLQLVNTLVAVAELHKPYKVYDECEHGTEEHEGSVYVEDIGYTCKVQYLICKTCCTRNGDILEECLEHLHGESIPICETAAVLNNVPYPPIQDAAK